jgi:ABC-type xylose transport system permease subunit
MLRSALLALLVTGLASVVARAQAINPTPGTEAAQTNGLLGTPFWIIVGVIIAFAVLFAFRVWGRRRR